MENSYYIQGSDLSDREKGELKSVSQLQSLFETYDWASEHALQTRLEESGEEYYPAQFGIVKETGVFLTLIQNVDGTVSIHAQYDEPFKLFGVLPWSRSRTVDSLSSSKNLAMESISRFLRSDNAWLAQNIRDV